MGRATICFRVAAGLIVLFAAGHTLGFRRTDPRWGVDATLSALRHMRFTTQGFQRNYLDFYDGFGLFVTLFLAFSALVAWQLGTPAPGGVAGGPLRVVAWGLVFCFAVNAVLSWRYFFPAPLFFSAVIAALLLAGTLLSR